MAQSVDPTQPSQTWRFIGTGLGSRTPSGPAVQPDCKRILNRHDTGSTSPRSVGRSRANLGHYKSLFASVDRTFGNQFHRVGASRKKKRKELPSRNPTPRTPFFQAERLTHSRLHLPNASLGIAANRACAASTRRQGAQLWTRISALPFGLLGVVQPGGELPRWTRYGFEGAKWIEIATRLRHLKNTTVPAGAVASTLAIHLGFFGLRHTIRYYLVRADAVSSRPDRQARGRCRPICFAVSKHRSVRSSCKASIAIISERPMPDPGREQ
jgi:hypothetical protein